MKKIVVLTFILTLLCSCSMNPAKQAGAVPQRYTADIYGVFDTAVSLTAYCDSRESFEAVKEKAEEEFREMNRLFDRYNTYSGINNIRTINDNAGKMPVEVDKRITELLLFGVQTHKSTS